MRTIHKTIVTLLVTVFSVTLSLLVTILVASACSEKVTLRFETGSGSYLASIEGKPGGSYQKPGDPTLEGYFFDGWYGDAACEGERLSLPEVMPAESQTYYAKYIRCPLLTLDVSGGELQKTQHYLRPGVSLPEYLSGYIPQKEGLLFGGWEGESGLLPDEAVMPETDLTLHARYKASYEVAVYLQSAEDPARYEKSEAYSFKGADWEQEEYRVEVPVIDHFLFEEEGAALSGVLHAGENLFQLHFQREQLTLSFQSLLPSGEAAQWEQQSLYGAQLPLEQPGTFEGYEFFGWWAGEREYAAGTAVLLEQSMTLTGKWGKLYPNLRGEGTLAVEVGEEAQRRAVYAQGEERTEGLFLAESGTFTAGSYSGKLAHGGFLPDDSGEYVGCDLSCNGVGEKFGVLTLEFSSGTAHYRIAQRELSGRYEYLYDESAGQYTGNYLFTAAEEQFPFRLTEQTFLREGRERNLYSAFDPLSGQLLPEHIALDGYGGASLMGAEGQLKGSYRGGDRADEWVFTPEKGQPFRILLAERVWADGLACEKVYLRHSPSLAGEYRSREGGSLTLDGYGLEGILRLGEEVHTGSFLREEDTIILQGEEEIRLVLSDGNTFAPAGEEYGAYEGKFGTLRLNGAGGARLLKGDTLLRSGSYRKVGDDWLFTGEDPFRFRLFGESYRVYDEGAAGVYNSYFGKALQLDGYGGGIYYPVYGGEMEVEVLYGGETLFVLTSPTLRTRYGALALRLDPVQKTVQEISTASAGVFEIKGEQGLLILDGSGGAILREGDEKFGTYQQIADTDEVLCNFGERILRFRILSEEGKYSCLKSDAAGTFRCGESELFLDGYGSALYRGEEEFTARYRITGGAEKVAEIERENTLFRFRLDGESFTLLRYSRYTSKEGVLWLEEGGRSAIYRGEREYIGMYTAEQYFVATGLEFPYRLHGGQFFRYVKEQEGEFFTAEGGRVLLDGCGKGTFFAGETVLEGEAFRTESGILVLSSPDAGTLSGQIGFLPDEEGVLHRAGEEFGWYEGEAGGLFLLGDGRAYCKGEGGWLAGSYLPLEEGEKEYTFRAEGKLMRFRLEKSGTGGRYLCYRAALAQYAGRYAADEGELLIDGYKVTLDGREFCFLCGGEGGFIAEEIATGKYFAVRLSEEGGGAATLSAAEGRLKTAKEGQ